MRQLVNWINTYPDGAKRWVGVGVFMTVCYILIAIGLLSNRVGLGEFISRENAGLAGQIIFWGLAVVYANCIRKILFGKM